MLLGEEKFKKLQQACVTIVGLGAVGSYAIEALARAGVGHLRLFDFDEVRLSNINRQLYALSSTVGRPKVEIARERVLDINPECRVEAFQTFIHTETMEQVLAGPPDVLIDAIDSLAPKTALLTAAAQAGLRVISSMGAAKRTNPADIRAGDISKTKNCPLARLLRRRLKKNGISSGIHCIYSIELVEEEETLETEENASPPEEEFFKRGRTRQPLGSLSYLTGMFGLYAACETIRFIVEG
jgi:tRNA A37 threonylcarbamoyladenosine dehydratase